MPFPGTALATKVELALGADLTASPASWSWSDVTAWFRVADGISITRGRGDETAQADPSTCRLTFDNRDGRFSARNPLGPYYGQLRRNTPLRVRFDGGTGSGFVTRFTGYVSEWPPRWDLSGKDAWAPVVANGIMRRLQQGERPLRSPLWRAIKIGSPAPKQYWPMTDRADSNRAASGLTRFPPLFESVPGTVRFAADTGLPGSAALPDFTDGGRLYGMVPPYAAGGGQFTVDGWFRSTGSTTHVPFEWRTPDGNTNRFTIEVTSAAVFCRPYNALTGAEIGGGAVTLAGTFMDERWHNVRVEVTTTGVDMLVAIFVDGVAGGTFNAIGANNPGAVYKVIVNPSLAAGPLLGVGHIGVWSSDAVPEWTSAGNGYRGETAGARIQRICAEESVPYQSSGVEAASEPMGPQPATLTEILRDCEATDGGILYETTGGHIAYLTRRARYNKPVALALDFAAAHVAAAPEPTDDDQRIRNDITAARADGSSAQVVDGDHIAAHGRYDEQVTINPAGDLVLDDHAGWRVHLGTVDELRWPSVSLNLGNIPALIGAWLAADIGFRLTVANPPIPGDLVDLVIEGWSEYSDGDRIWTVDLNCAPASPWLVGVRDDTGKGRRDTAGSELAAQFVSGVGTSMSVATTAGPLWTTAGGDVPFDVIVAGVRLTVTAISGGSSPQTFTVTQTPVNGIGKTIPSGTPVNVWRPAVRGL